MSQKALLAFAVVVLLATLTTASTVYIVYGSERVVITRFGQVLRDDDPPGLHFKYPFVDRAHFIDSRILTLDAERQSVLTQDKKYVVVDSYVDWRVIDPLKYYQTVRGREAEAQQRLEPLVNSALRDAIGARTEQDVISSGRADIMKALAEKTAGAAREFGIQVVDARLQRVDLPDDVTQSVYKRMEAEGAGVAKLARAEGAEAADKIRAEADRKREALLADAYRQSETIRGEGDARAAAIAARAAARAPEFYTMYRSLNAYKRSFKKKDDLVIVDPSSDFFRYWKKPTP